ncbi:MAG: intradiol ring-cleavage dioxygenase [Proteobacteria bacterium]|nr:intradiol ring-cleavage dioxygenase [Pseudomonadota bacterium]
MTAHQLDRRPFLRAAGALIASAALPRLPAYAADTRVATPRQTAGPFYPTRFPDDVDNDLVVVAGRPRPAEGQVVHLAGQVLDRDGRPVRGARVEIWQCDIHGRYHHVDSSWQTQRSDDNFQGYGRTVTDDAGTYRFRTIRPVAYSGRTPHIHVAVAGTGIERLVTQMYLAGEPLNERDPVLSHIRDPRARQAVTVAFEAADTREPGALGARFDIVLG